MTRAWAWARVRRNGGSKSSVGAGEVFATRTKAEGADGGSVVGAAPMGENGGR